MGNKLTDNEIIEALECCLQEYGNCDDCPYKEYECVGAKGENIFMQDILDLINRQRGELRKKQVKIHKLLKELNQIQDYYDIQKAEIERLKHRKCLYSSDGIELSDCISGDCFHRTTECEVKTEAIEEFAERLKTRIKNMVLYCYDIRFIPHLQQTLEIILKEIDDLVKEMTEVKENDGIKTLS